jgi:hypothetical protein
MEEADMLPLGCDGAIVIFGCVDGDTVGALVLGITDGREGLYDGTKVTGLTDGCSDGIRD